MLTKSQAIYLVKKLQPQMNEATQIIELYNTLVEFVQEQDTEITDGDTADSSQ